MNSIIKENYGKIKWMNEMQTIPYGLNTFRGWTITYIHVHFVNLRYDA